MGAPARAHGAVRDTAAAFDQLADRIDNGDLLLDTRQTTEATLARLHGLVPPDDARRQLRYETEACFFSFDDAQAGQARAREGIARARKAGDRKAEADFHYCSGVFKEMGPRPREALAEYEAGIALARKLEDDRLMADGFTLRGNTLSLLGEQALALKDFLAAQRIYDARGLVNDAIDNLINIAVGYRRLGQYDKADAYLARAHEHAAQRHDLYDLYAVAMQRAFLAMQRRHAADALAPLGDALDLARRMGRPSALGGVYLARADAENDLHRFADALADSDRARSVFARVLDRSNTGMVALQEGRALAGLGRRKEATDRFDAAEADLSKKNLRYLVELYADRAANEEALHHDARALDYLKRKIEADASLARMTQAQYATLVGIQFDTAQREMENRRLAADKVLRDQQLASLQRVRHWQGLAILFGALLTLLLGWLAIRQLRHTRRYQRLAMTDTLTGIANRRRIEELTMHALNHSRISDAQLSVVLLDVDHFKRINDARGHAVGDRVLVAVVEACKRALRQHDRIGRVGGEEFMVLLPDTDLVGAMQVAERIREAILIDPIEVDDASIRVTASLGVTAALPGDAGPESLVQRADTALYRAKQRGRNRVEAVA